MGGTDGMALREADSEAVSDRLLVVAQSIMSHEMAGTD